MGVSPEEPLDPRLKAYCDPFGPEVFHAVAHRQDIWREDPFDVEHIHAEARESFQRLVNQGLASDRPEPGRILLLKGEAGAGKTHLMRAFRSFLHRRGEGYFGYMQMSTQTDNYSRYMLRNLIDSLEKPYWESSGPQTGLMRLSNALVEGPQCERLVKRCGARGPKLVPKLREGSSDPVQLHKLVQFLSEHLVQDALESVDIDVLSALLYLQTGDPVLKNFVLKYLNAQGLSPAQRARLGDMAPRTAEEDPLEVLEQLARVMWATHRSILVLCLDQLEDIHNMDQAEARFRRAMSAVSAFIDKVPSSVVVISCLGDFYTRMRESLAGPVRDRLETSPEPIELEGRRNEREVRDMVELRLRHYFEAFDLPLDEEEPLYPFRPEDLKELASLRSRDVLENCRIHRERAIQEQRLPTPTFEAETPPREPRGNVQELQQAWNDHVRDGDFQTPEDDLSRVSLLSEALERSGKELDPPEPVRTNCDGTRMHVAFGAKRLWIGLCNKSPKGGALARQLKEVVESAAGREIVLVRTTDWPSNPRTKICQYLGRLLSKGARRAMIEESDWLTMTAYPAFEAKNGERPEFKAWRRTDRPLTSLPAIRAILALRERTVTRAEPESPPDGPSSSGPVSPNGPKGAMNPESTSSMASSSQGTVVLGSVQGRIPRPVEVHPAELTRHAAFLGGTGSGKSTAAMVLVEQLLLSGIPALLVDRKGDLCCYADPDLWQRPASSQAAEARRVRLLESMDVNLYTPGDPRGRSLSITLVPEGASELSSIEREQISGYAASALCQMMGYNLSTARPKSLHAILKCAIDVLARLVAAERVTLEELVKMLDEQDPALLNAVGKLDVKLFDRLVNDLETLRLGKGRLLESDAERLSMDRLLGRGAYHREGRTQLSILSTKFLGDEQDALFWVAQLLIELGRWTSRNPRKELQAVVMFDEADLYLPAAKKPATKEPMENLLKRARSAGLGILLASQNPGDFDYRCRDNIRTWVLGLIKEEPSLRKMRPMLKEFREDITARLPAQSIGQFHLVREGKVERMNADRSAIDLQQLSEERILTLARH